MFLPLASFVRLPLVALALLHHPGAGAAQTPARTPHTAAASLPAVQNLGLGIDHSRVLHVEGTRAVFSIGNFSGVRLFDLESGTVLDTGLDPTNALSARAFGDFVLGAVRESTTGTDANGDGDTTDQVVALFAPSNGTTTFLSAHPGYAFPINSAGRYVAENKGVLAIEVGESQEGGIDRNGDGDSEDVVVQTFLVGEENRIQSFGGTSPASVPLTRRAGLLPSTSTLFGVLYFPFESTFVATRDHVLVGVSECSIGSGVDLNGDGDALDGRILHALPVRGGPSRNLGVEVGLEVRRLGPDAAALVPEFLQAADLNGDGDQDDRIFHVWKDDPGVLVNTNIHAERFVELSTMWRLGLPEAELDLDLNADGDRLDTVDHLYDSCTGSLVNLGVELTRAVEIGGVLLVGVDEDAQGEDLNGDGDARDVVLHEYEIARGELTSLVTAIGAIGEPLIAGSRLGAILVNERAQQADFNFDGDTLDNVVGVYDAVTDTYANLALATNRPLPGSSGRYQAFLVNEEADGERDLNGDGDTEDDVLHVYDAVAGEVTSTGLHVSGIAVSEELLFFGVDEFAQGQDLNGDGLLDQVIAHVVDLRSP